MKIRSAIAALVVPMGLLSMTACGDFPQACEGMVATENEKKVLELGGEVERNDNSGNECELNHDLTWSEDL